MFNLNSTVIVTEGIYVYYIRVKFNMVWNVSQDYFVEFLKY